MGNPLALIDKPCNDFNKKCYQWNNLNKVRTDHKRLTDGLTYLLTQVAPKEFWKIFYIPDIIMVISSFLSSCEQQNESYWRRNWEKLLLKVIVSSNNFLTPRVTKIKKFIVLILKMKQYHSKLLVKSFYLNENTTCRISCRNSKVITSTQLKVKGKPFGSWVLATSMAGI